MSFFDIILGVYYSRSKYASNMIGTGMTPEGINQNYINFDVMSEVAWRVEPVNPALFAQAYIQRRYGDENLNFNVKCELYSPPHLFFENNLIKY